MSAKDFQPTVAMTKPLPVLQDKHAAAKSTEKQYQASTSLASTEPTWIDVQSLSEAFTALSDPKAIPMIPSL